MTKRRAIGPREVLGAACELAEELSTTPTQQMIADSLHCSKTHISSMFVTLEFVGAIEWITRHTYAITDAEWIPPKESKI